MTRFGYVMTAYFATMATIVTAFIHPSPRLIWNASASVPIGLYVMRPLERLHIAELVVVCPPNTLAQFLAGRRYLPEGVPMLKRVLALPGQIICRNAHTVTVDGIAMGEALDRDTQGRPLPVWAGCQRLFENEVFLMNWQSKDSFDGRYFGPLPTTSVIGRADPLWIRED